MSTLTDSDGELAETPHWLDTARACGYLDEDAHAALMDRCDEIGRMLGSMIHDPARWCRPR